MSLQAFASFYLRLGEQLQSGVPLQGALSSAIRKKSGQALAAAALRAIDTGGRFSDGLADGGAPPLDVAIVRMAEETGTLGEACLQLADAYDYRIKIRDLWRQGLSSPFWALILLTLALLGATYRFHGPAVALVRLGYVAGVAGFFGASWFGLRFLLRAVPLLRLFVDRLGLSLPLFGGVLLDLARGRFFFCLAQVYASGQTAAVSLELAAGASGNAFLERRLRKKSEGLVGGGSLVDALRGESIVDGDGLDILESAELAGSLDRTLARLAQRYREQGQRVLERRLPLLARMLLIPPVVLFLFLGLIDIFWTLLQQVGGQLSDQVSKIKIPSIELPKR